MRFQSIGNAPLLKRQVFKISSGAKFGRVVASLRKQLGMDTGGSSSSSGGGMGESSETVVAGRAPPPPVRGEGLWCYVNQSFAPALDAEVGGLWKGSTLHYTTLHYTT